MFCLGYILILRCVSFYGTNYLGSGRKLYSYNFTTDNCKATVSQTNDGSRRMRRARGGRGMLKSISPDGAEPVCLLSVIYMYLFFLKTK